MKPPAILNINVLVWLILFMSGCETGDHGIVTGSTTAPTVVRGAYSYVLTFEAVAASISLQDTIRWYPHVAYLTVTVARYSNGTGTLDITDSSGVHQVLMEFDANVEVLNRELSAPMPLVLRLSLQGFTGTITCVVQMAPAELSGMVAHFALRDSAGTVRSTFVRGAPVDFSYSLLNQTGQTQPWSKGDGRPYYRFTVWRAGVLTADSFDGLAWIMVPETGILQPGDSLQGRWWGNTREKPFPPGHYTAWAEPQFLLNAFGTPSPLKLEFDVTP